MKQVLKILNSLVVLTISSTAVIACGATHNPLPNITDYWRSELARLEATKKTTNDEDEIAVINQKINQLVAEWVTTEISSIHALGFKIEVTPLTSWETILQKTIPDCFSEYFSSHLDLKNYFYISKLNIPTDQTETYDSFTNRYLINYNYDKWPTDEIKSPAYIEIIRT